MSAIIFRNTTFDIIDRNNQPWLRGLQVASALGYKNQAADIQNLYNRHADEFTDSMTAVIKLPTAGGEQETRIFSPRGCYALGMFARTKIAKEFRVWVLDVLEGKISAPKPKAIPVKPEPKVTIKRYCSIHEKTEGGNTVMRFERCQMDNDEMTLPRVMGFLKTANLKSEDVFKIAKLVWDRVDKLMPKQIELKV